MTLSTETHAPYPSLTRACTVVLILFATAVLAYTDRQVLSLLVDPIRHDLHISDMQMSLLLGTAFAAIYGVAGVPLGFLADRTSRRNLIVAGVLIWQGMLNAETGCEVSAGSAATRRTPVRVTAITRRPAGPAATVRMSPSASKVGVVNDGADSLGRRRWP